MTSAREMFKELGYERFETEVGIEYAFHNKRKNKCKIYFWKKDKTVSVYNYRFNPLGKWEQEYREFTSSETQAINQQIKEFGWNE